MTLRNAFADMATEATLAAVKTAVETVAAKPDAPTTVALDSATINAVKPQATQPVSAAALPLPAGASTETTLTALKAAIDTLSAKITTCNTGAVTLDGPTLVALETITAAISGTVAVSNFPAVLTDAQLRASAVPVSGVFYQGTQPVSGTFWQATQPVSGTVTIANPTALGLTDTQLRASAVPVSGAFYQATQPVSAAALPLPAGAATEATLAELNAKLPAVANGRVQVELPAGGGGLTNTELRDSPIPTADDTVGGLLRRMLALLMSPRGYDKLLARQRGTVVVETLPVLSTVNNLGNLAQIAGRDGVMLINPTNRTSWALNHRSRIS